ncbi:GerAB/ArcD/ProY family transporter [Metabacillus bambusae]|uniref:GerAB/ArcD/ProY family transporter n=1 Tax=Metabacillus bambusae TaxID=2795218 RepID=A0ABS3MZH9_9BACI|nr:GerAB/ArcD/ProY family transporter [Metabacillus bambusae]MBO1511225.1 GerAB/ArcD/ProY family transporter [Metabacillus bambusae]
MSKQVKESLTVSPFFLFFLIHGTQTGVGMLSFQSKIIKGAEQDAWVSVLLVGFSFHLIIWLMYFLLKKSNNGDIFSLHKQLFGKWIGNIFNLCFYGYIIVTISTIVRSYVEILQVWVFPYIHLWELSLIIVLATTYIVSGGFRVVTGMCFWGVVLPSILFITLYFPLKYANWNNLLPLFNHNFVDYIVSAKQTIFNYLGPELLLIYFPFIKNNNNSQKWAHISIAYTTILYFIITIVTFVYFNIQQLEHTVWPTLISSKIIRLPFIERFEYIYIFAWLLVILPPSCVFLWGGSRILRKTINLKPKTSLWISSSIVFFIVINLKSEISIKNINSFISTTGLVLVYCYIPILFFLLNIINFFKRRKSLEN